MTSGTQARAQWRALFSAALIGSGVGLGLGAAYLAAGMAGHAEDHAHARQMAEAAATGYSGSYLEAQGRGMRTGLERYGFSFSSSLPTFDPRAAQKARRKADLECLTTAVYYEARGESSRGQAAVAQVVMNRVKHPAFPKSVCAVVFQGAGHPGCQFSFACDGSMRRSRELEAWDRARKVATRALAGAALAEIGKATHFHTTAVAPSWAPQMLRVTQVGVHVFYKFQRVRNGGSLAERAVLAADPVPKLHELRIEPALLEIPPEASQTVEAAAETTKPATEAAAAEGQDAAALGASQPTAASAS